MIPSENDKYTRGVKNVLSILKQDNINTQIRSFGVPAHHAREAAEMLGCPLGAVVKSLVFQKSEDNKVVLVLVSGENRVDTIKLGRILGYTLRPAKHRDVQELTGYPVGAVPPIGLKGDFPVIIDEDLVSYDFVWAAAGSAMDLFRVIPQDLQTLTKGKLVNLKQE